MEAGRGGMAVAWTGVHLKCNVMALLAGCGRRGACRVASGAIREGRTNG